MSRLLRRNSSFFICATLLCLVISDPFYVFTAILWLAIGKDNYTLDDFIEDSYRHSPTGHVPPVIAVCFVAVAFCVARIGIVDLNVSSGYRTFVPIFSSALTILLSQLVKIELSIASAVMMYFSFLMLCILMIKVLQRLQL